MTDTSSHLSRSVVEKGNRRSPATWLWLILFVAASVMLLAVAYEHYRNETDRITQREYEKIAAIGKLKAGQIEQWRSERINDLRRSTKVPFFGQVMQEWVQDRTDTTLQRKLQNWLAVEQESHGYSDVLVFDLDCNVLLSAEPQPDPMSPALKETIEQAIANRSLMLADLYRCPMGIVHLDAVGPILDAGERPIAVLVLRSDAESSLYPLIQSWPTPSSTPETLLVRKDGEDVLFLNDLRHRPESALSLRQNLTQTDLTAVQAVLGTQGIHQGKDYRGVEVLADLRPIANSPWFMVAKVDKSEVLAEAHYRGAVTAIFVVLFIVLAASLTAYLYRRRQARLYKELYRSERNQRHAQENFRTILYSIGDGVITMDTGGLVRQMNPVAEDLTGWRESEAAGRPLEEIFHIINEKTRQVCENPVEKILKHGQIVGLGNNTILISRDGTEQAIADSGALIKDEHGQTLGVVLVFRDVTERARAAEELRKNEEMLSAILAASPVGIVLTQNSKIKWSNDAWMKMFGFADKDEYLDQPSSVMHASQEDYEQFRQGLYDNLKPGGIYEIDASLKRQDGTLFDSRIRIKLLDSSDPSKGTISAIADISEKKRDHEALVRSEEKYRRIIENTQDLIYQADMEGRLVFASPSFEQLLGFTPEEFLGRRLTELCVLPEERARFLNLLIEKGSVTDFEVELIAKDGSHVWVCTNAKLFKDEMGHNICVEGVTRDVTAKKEADEALREREAYLRAMLNNAPFLMWLKDKDGRFLAVNDVFAESCGQQVPEALIGKTDLDVWPPDLAVSYRSDDREVMDLKMQKHVEEQVSVRGVIKWFETFKTPVLDEGGKLIGTTGFARDITHRKRADEALRESEQTFRTIVEGAPDAVFVQIGGLFAYLNGPAVRLFGAESLDDLVGKPVMDRFHPGFREAVGERIRSLNAGKKAVPSLEEIYLRMDGSEVHVEVAAVPIHFQGQDGALVFVRDITDKKLAESQTAEANEFREKIISQSPMAIQVYRADGQCISANEESARIVGADKERLLTQNFRNLSSWKDSGLLADAEQVLSGGANNQREVRNVLDSNS